MTDRTQWSRPINLDAALAGGPPPAPTIGWWKDSLDGKTVTRALFYPNEVHSVGGEPESMKSWLVLWASVQEIKLRRHVVYVDMEANDRSIVHRLKLLGATNARIKKHFHYFRPDGPVAHADHNRFNWMLANWKPTLVVLDGVTEAYALNALSINASEDAARWFGLFARRFQIKRATADYDGPAIVELDHVVKDRDGRGPWTIGSQHKKAGIKGAMYMVESTSPFGAGKHGVSRLLLAKDSPGGVDYTSIVSKGQRKRYVADLHCDASSVGAIDAYIETADVSETRDADADLPVTEQYAFRQLMQEVAEYIAREPGASMRSVRGGVKGTNERIALAIDQLERDGFVVNKGSGNKRQYVSVKEFKPSQIIFGEGGAK